VTDGGLTNDVDAVPYKVLLPLMTPRVEQRGYLVCFWIDTREIRALAKIAVNAREREVVHGIGTAVLLGNDVFDM